MKIFDVSILPRATRINIDCLDLVVVQSLLDFSSDKIGAIVTADIAAPPYWIMACYNTPKTSAAVIYRLTWMAKDGRLYSSSSVIIFKVQPFSVRSRMKSQVHTWWRWAAWVGSPVETSGRGIILGFDRTLSPSRRRIRWTCLRLTVHGISKVARLQQWVRAVQRQLM